MASPLPRTHLGSQRHLFGLPRQTVYYNCAYLSPMLEAVQKAGEAGLALKKQPWQVFPRDFFTEADSLRECYAQLIGASPKDIAIVPSVSYGIGVAAANLPVRKGGSLLLLDEQFPSNVYPWHALAASRDAKIVRIARPADGNWTPHVLDALDSGCDLAALPNCHWTDGSLLDLQTIGRRCRELGIPLVLDVTQSVGALPIDVKTIKPAFMVAAGYKWLLGPYGLTLMYVDPEYHDGRPLEYNWINREGSEDFSKLVQYTDAVRQDASRYDMGERSNFLLLPMAIAAIKQLLAWDPAHIQETLAAYNLKLAQALLPLGFQPPQVSAGHLMGIRHPGGLPTGLAQQLKESQVFVSIRGDAIRLAPHLYNDEEDIERFTAILTKLMQATS